jgi:NTE family protein
VFRIAAEDEIDGLAQRSAVDLGRSFVEMLHQSGRAAADRWLKHGPDQRPPAIGDKPAELNASLARSSAKEAAEV